MKLKTNKEIEDEVNITSFSPQANLHRNSHRRIVDGLFAKKERFMKAKPALAKKYDIKARNIWRRIIKEANLL